MSNVVTAAALRLAESVLGRSGLWRASRRLYLTARRDGMGDPAANGEYALHGIVAARAASAGETFTAVDVGAFSGYWSHHLLSACKAAGVRSARLVAFEPSSGSRKKFDARMHAAFPGYDVRVRPEAISDKAGEALFNLDPSLAGANRLVAPASRNGGEAGTAERVIVLTLPQVFAEEGLATADFVKTDAEGFDLGIIKGALPLLEGGKIGLLQFEYNHCWLDTRSQLRDVFDLLPQIPYRLCKVAPGGLEAYVSWSSEIERYYEANYALVRNDLAAAYMVKSFEFDSYNTLRPIR